jgi:hypothetical protein
MSECGISNGGNVYGGKLGIGEACIRSGLDPGVEKKVIVFRTIRYHLSLLEY